MDASTIAYPNLDYCSPEQSGMQNVTDRTDIWSLGASILHAMTGNRPYGDATPLAISTAHCQGVAPIVPLEVPEPMARLLRECLDINPARRPSALQLRSKLGVLVFAGHPDTEPLDDILDNHVSTFAQYHLVSTVDMECVPCSCHHYFLL